MGKNFLSESVKLKTQKKSVKLLYNRHKDTNSPFHVFYIYTDKNTPTYAHSHDFFEFFITREGKEIHFINGKTYCFNENTVCLIREDDIHFYKKSPDSKFLSKVNTVLTKKIFCDTINFLNIKKEILNYDKIFYKEFNKNKIDNLITKLTYLHRADKLSINEKEYKIKLLLSELLIDLLESQNNNLIDYNYPQWLKLCLHQFKTKNNYKKGIKELIIQSGKSQEYFSRTLKRYTDKTPTQYINELKLKDATNMLIETNKSILEIIFESGFNNVSHFNKIFKKYYNESPRNFRKNAKDYLNLHKAIIN